MPYTLKTQQIAVKDPDTGAYSGVDILTEQTTEGLLTEIIATGNEVKTDVAAQMATERSDFNTYVSGKEAELDQYKSTTETNINTYVTNKNQEIATMIADADEDVSDLEDRKQDVATAVSGMLSKGVDNSLTTANVPAESKAVGDLFETIVEGKSTQPNDKWNRLWIKPSASDYEIPTMDDLDEVSRHLSDVESEFTNNLMNVVNASASSATVDWVVKAVSVSVSQGQYIMILVEYDGNNGDYFKIRLDKNGTLVEKVSNAEFGKIYYIKADQNYTGVNIQAHFNSPYTPGGIMNIYASTDGFYKNTNVELIVSDNFKEFFKNRAAIINANLYKETELVQGRIFKGVFDGSITTIKVTDYIPVIPSHKYSIYGGYFSSDNYVACYDFNKQYIGSTTFDELLQAYPYGNSTNHVIWTVPQDVYFIRVNFFVSDITGTFPMDFYFYDLTGKVWANKKVLVIGDSISTDVYGSYKKWVSDLIDDGFFTKSKVTNDSMHATGFVATYSGDSNTTFINRLTAVGDLTGLDAVITFGGINDWIQSIDFDAFKTAVDTYFAYLIEHATQARIIVFSPLHTALYGTTNSAGKTQKDYDDYIKSVAKDYAFPCLNLTDESGFCPDKSATFSDMWTLLPEGFSDHDGVHPNETWEKNFLAPMIKGFLSNL